jgi:hypothetical protein
VAVDNGTHEPVVGELITGDDTGAVGKVISFTDTGGNWGAGTGTGTLCMGACAGRFNNDETCTGDDGSPAGFDINMPPTAAGVDPVRNGGFTADEDPPQGWTAVGSATLTTEGGGKAGNCLKITEGGENSPRATQDVSVTAGKLYKFTAYALAGTENEYYVELYDVDNAISIWATGWLTEVAAGWNTEITHTFEAPAGCTQVKIDLRQRALNGEAKNFYYDEISLYGTTPCCTEANAKAMDGWLKDTTLDLYREHHGSNVPEGVFYSCLSVPTAQNDFCLSPAGIYTKEEWYEPAAGKTFTVAAYVKSSTADDFKLVLADGDSDTLSDAHSGGSDFEWLEVTKTMTATPSQFHCGWRHVAASPGNAYIAAIILILGSSIGESNYTLAPGEVVRFEKDVVLTDYDLGVGDVLTDIDSELNIEAQSEGKIPKGVAELYLNIRAMDSVVADTIGVWMGPDTTYCANGIGDVGLELAGLGNDKKGQAAGWVRCNAAGDPWLFINESGAGQLDCEIRVQGVRLR